MGEECLISRKVLLPPAKCEEVLLTPCLFSGMWIFANLARINCVPFYLAATWDWILFTCLLTLWLLFLWNAISSLFSVSLIKMIFLKTEVVVLKCNLQTYKSFSNVRLVSGITLRHDLPFCSFSQVCWLLHLLPDMVHHRLSAEVGLITALQMDQ